jgi:hypothetical protein
VELARLSRAHAAATTLATGGARRAPAHPLLALQRAAGNRAVANAIQRAITVGDDIYTIDDAREFRRSLMLKLKALGFAETGTKPAWAAVDEALGGGTDWQFATWEQMIGAMVERGLLDKPLRGGGPPTGPRRLGERPRWSSETAEAVARARTGPGLAARHVLASSTLGLAIERSNAPLSELNAWLKEHRQDEHATDFAARRAIWSTVHNFAGNLWMGPTEANTAIGFVRPALLAVRTKIVDTVGGVDVKAVRSAVQSRYVTGGQDNERNRTWNLLLGDLDAELAALGDVAPRADVEDLVDMYYRNADIDPPALKDDEYKHVVAVWELLQNPATVLEGLRRFMSRPLARSIAMPQV